MELTDGDVAEYEARGLLCFPGLLQGEEVAALQGALPALLVRGGPEGIRETDAQAARRVFGGAHPLTPSIEDGLQEARAALRARETPPPGGA